MASIDTLDHRVFLRCYALGYSRKSVAHLLGMERRVFAQARRAPMDFLTLKDYVIIAFITKRSLRDVLHDVMLPDANTLECVKARQAYMADAIRDQWPEDMPGF